MLLDWKNNALGFTAESALGGKWEVLKRYSCWALCHDSMVLHSGDSSGSMKHLADLIELMLQNSRSLKESQIEASGYAMVHRRGTSTSKEHDTELDALREADRLAEENPGVGFNVLVTTHRVAVAKPIVEHKFVRPKQDIPF